MERSHCVDPRGTALRELSTPRKPQTRRMQNANERRRIRLEWSARSESPVAALLQTSEVFLADAMRCEFNCSTRGVCLDGRCLCAVGYSGNNCHLPCRSDCAGHGLCVACFPLIISLGNRCVRDWRPAL